MSFKRSNVLVGAVALAIGSSAMANTSLDTTVGDLFLNIVNTTNNTSFVYDTGISQASFNGGGSYSIPIASDPNYTAFLAAAGTLDYSVVSATAPTTSTSIVDFTSSVAVPTNVSTTAINTARSTVSGFLVGANSVTSTTANSALLSTAFEYGAATTEGVISNQLLNVNTAPYGDSAAIDTPLSFYQDTVSGARGSQTTGFSTFAGTWDLSSSGVLTYTSNAVPLPAPVVLLLSGLGLMGVVARRKRAV
jgi:hypothetical protein